MSEPEQEIWRTKIWKIWNLEDTDL